jgi:hypothetical protein
MTMVIGFDQHRAQITYDLLDSETGEATTGWRFWSRSWRR